MNFSFLSSPCRLHLSFPVCLPKRKHKAAASQQLSRRAHFPPTYLRDQEPPQIYGTVDSRLTDLIQRIIAECESALIYCPDSRVNPVRARGVIARILSAAAAPAALRNSRNITCFRFFFLSLHNLQLATLLLYPLPHSDLLRPLTSFVFFFPHSPRWLTLA